MSPAQTPKSATTKQREHNATTAMANTSNTSAGRAAGSTAGAAASNLGPTAPRRTGAKELIRRRGQNGGKGARRQDGGKGGRGRPPPQVRRPRRPRRRPGEAALAEIRKMQKSTELIISKAAISRLIREICQEDLGRKPGEDLRWTSAGIAAVHTAAEDYMTKIFESTNRLAIHAKRVTILPKDMQLARELRDK
jgi:histone H3/H4